MSPGAMRGAAGFALLALAACGRPPEAAVLTVGAAASLRELLEAAARAYESERPEVDLQFSFDSSSSLSRQIENGFGFAAFLSADAASVERVRGRLAAETIRPFLSNALVLVGRYDLAAPVHDPGELRGAGGPIAVGGPAVPAGRYARVYLERRGLLAALEPRLVNADNVRAALALVESGAADYAFVYATDARIAPTARLLWTAGAEDDPGIVYVAAAVQGAGAAASRFLEWLHGPTFQELALQHGFLPPPR